MKKNVKTNNLVVLVSGGRSSAMTAFTIHNSPKYKDYNKLYLFINTSMERSETFDFLLKIRDIWGIPLHFVEGVYSNEIGVGVKSKEVDFENLKMDGSIFSSAIEQVNKITHFGVPNQSTPYCSDYLKKRVTHDFCRNYFGTTKFIKAIGYRKEDMPKRITLKELKEEPSVICPLLTDFEVPIGQLELNTFFDTQPFKLNLHSRLTNCELCWKKSRKNLIEVLQDKPRFIEWVRNEEKKWGNSFFRDNLTIDDLVNIAESGVQTSLFEDNHDPCMCSF